jgi:hypothetical protein
MPFQRETNPTKDAIQHFRLAFDVIILPAPLSGGVLEVRILKSDDQTVYREYPEVLDLLDEDSEGQIHKQNLASLRDYILARLNNEVLPI